MECTALLAGVRAGHLDAVEPPVAPLDVLAQQLVAEVAAAGECGEDDLFDMVRHAAPYAGLDRATFDEVVDLVSWGIVTGRGRRGAYLHRDGVNGRLRPRRGARLAALTSGGAIPETGDYRVVLDPDGVTVGSVHEDFAVEANIGDVFLLGTHSWRVRQVEVGTVRVHDAGDAPPTVPFWLGEAPSRTAELSEEVGALRAAVEPYLAGADGAGARREVRRRAGVSDEVCDQVVAYLAAGRAALGALPTRQRLVVERFFDESEGTQLVVHSPYGGRVNRALGLALRKRFCVSFDFELQAAADDDTVVLSLGPQHSFPLSQVAKMVNSRTVVDVLTQAVLPHPMLAARWRWNCNRALVVPRSRGGQRRPIHLQRMDADDLLAAAWPALAACQENADAGPIPVPDHVLVRQTVADCLFEPLDAEGLVELVRGLEDGRVEVHLVESAEPSVLAHGILTGRPYTFLDGAPLEERRSRAVPLRRGLGVIGADGLPVPVDELGPLDAVGRGRRAGPGATGPARAPTSSTTCCCRSSAAGRWRPGGPGSPSWWRPGGRARSARRGRPPNGAPWPRRRSARAPTPTRPWPSASGATSSWPDRSPSPSWWPRARCPRAPRAARRWACRGPAPDWPAWRRRARPSSCPTGGGARRHLLIRLHAAGRSRRRRLVEPASIAEYVRFLGRWQHRGPRDSVGGPGRAAGRRRAAGRGGGAGG